jgi:exopolyphosphatase/guanosine-5'-triphosphate,3'-diphosphate pyrophosphatase
VPNETDKRPQRPVPVRAAHEGNTVEDSDSGARPPGDGASRDTATPTAPASPSPVRAPAWSGGAGPDTVPDGGDAAHNKSKSRKRRKRRRGRKVFARDGEFRHGQANGSAGAVGGQAVDGQKAANQKVTKEAVEADGQPPRQPFVQDHARQPEAALRPARRNAQDMPVFAALDLGTNNCRLLVAVPTRPGQFRVIDAFSRIVRLGEGMTASGRLGDAAMDRAVEALKICADKLSTRTLRRSRLIATEACRSADNGARFLERVRDETGLVLEIIDRRTEARLAVSGCGSLVERDTDGVVLFDIGGGSSEIALVDLSGRRTPRLANHIVAWTSLPVGVVSLAERFGGRDVTREAFGAMIDYVTELLRAFDGSDRLNHLMKETRFHLLGTSGTVTTLAGVHLNLERYDRRRVDGLWMDRGSVDAMVERLLGWDFDARVANPCIGADRADLVLAGCAILEAIRAVWPSERLRVADRGLREGILSELMADDGAWRRPWRGGPRP